MPLSDGDTLWESRREANILGVQPTTVIARATLRTLAAQVCFSQQHRRHLGVGPASPAGGVSFWNASGWQASIWRLCFHQAVST